MANVEKNLLPNSCSSCFLTGATAEKKSMTLCGASKEMFAFVREYLNVINKSSFKQLYCNVPQDVLKGWMKR